MIKSTHKLKIFVYSFTCSGTKITCKGSTGFIVCCSMMRLLFGALGEACAFARSSQSAKDIVKAEE